MSPNDLTRFFNLTSSTSAVHGPRVIHRFVIEPDTAGVLGQQVVLDIGDRFNEPLTMFLTDLNCSLPLGHRGQPRRTRYADAPVLARRSAMWDASLSH